MYWLSIETRIKLFLKNYCHWTITDSRGKEELLFNLNFIQP